MIRSTFRRCIITVVCVFFPVISSSLHAQSDDLADSTLVAAATDEEPVAPPPTVKAALLTTPPEEFTYAGARRYTMDGSLPPLETTIRPVSAAIVGGVYVGGIIALHINQSNAWWANQRGAFHIQEDWEYALQVDKAGHFFGGYMCSYVMSEGLMTAGLSWDAAAVWGGITGLMYQTYVEIEDGFARDWGFSPSDMASNTVGASFFVAQHYVPFLQNFTPKWQYVPSKWLDANTIPHETTFIDDYNGSTFWLSANVHNLLPEQAASYWPRWLNVAVGYNVLGVGLPEPEQRERRYIIGFDYNLVEILPDGPPLWNWLRQGLNHIKLPAPALVIGNTTSFRLFYPFTISTGIKF